MGFSSADRVEIFLFCRRPSPLPSGATVSAQGAARSPRLRRRRGASLTAPLPARRGGKSLHFSLQTVRRGSRDLAQPQIAAGDWSLDIPHAVDVRRLARQTANRRLGLGGVLVNQGPHLPAHQCLVFTLRDLLL